MEKRCGRCGVLKPSVEFSRSRSRPDGLQNRCKTCQLDANRQWAMRHPSVRRAALKRRYEREVEQGRRESKIATREKQNAHNAVYRAIKKGRMSRPSDCPECGGSEFPIHAHHADYSKPLDVQWVCAPCHGAIHAGGAA